MITKKQIENIQIDYGIIYKNYGEADEERLNPVRGGGEFSVTATVRDIEFDGAKGKTKGLQVIDDMNAALNVTIMDTSVDKLALALPYCTLEGDGDTTPYTLTGKTSNIGAIQDSSYLKNITMFARTVKGEYRKITLYEAMAENGLTFAAAPKGEGEIALEISAHWTATDDTKDLFKIETVASIS
ncbi:hypothetical protein [Clostridium sp. 'deep sea']|uniref:hypothetical protein n=1 Tax=Clostridium sp. 'deep sea' TaxID=2779445 RepID=UPI001FAC1E87|nr:hypothetical protein [Clostridium sp. 'deep sea']